MSDVSRGAAVVQPVQAESTAGLCPWRLASWLKHVYNVQVTTDSIITVMATMIVHPATPTMSATRLLAAMRQALRGHSTLCTMWPLMNRGPLQGKAILIRHRRLQLKRLRNRRTGVKDASSSEGEADICPDLYCPPAPVPGCALPHIICQACSPCAMLAISCFI